MMRIKEAIQRKKLIHEMNEEWRDYEMDNGMSSPIPSFSPALRKEDEVVEKEVQNGLEKFVTYLSAKLNEYQKRALKVTWKRLSEAPKTSGRGTIHIMEKVLSQMCEKEPVMNAIFYKSAFLSCIEDRRQGRTRCGSISTIRDHAHILVEFIDAIFQCMFEGVVKDGFDPEMIGASHCKLLPLGFERRMWHVLGECFAEVMFMQECIRAYPHAPSAWSLMAVTMTDRMYAASKPTQQARRDLSVETTRSSMMHLGQIGSSSSSMFNSNEEVFFTARTEFESPRCPFAHTESADGRLQRTDQKRRLFSQQHASDYFLRKHPIRIPRPTFGRSHSEVRFSSIPSYPHPHYPQKSSFV